MSRRRDVGQRYMIAAEPFAPLNQIGDIIQVMMKVGVSGADDLGVGLPQPEKALHHLLADEAFGNLAVELDVEPVDQAAHFGPRPRRVFAPRSLPRTSLFKNP